MKRVFAFSLFLFILSSFATPVFAQESKEEVILENINLNISEVLVTNKIYAPGDVVEGTFKISNTHDFDLGNVYYEVLLVGSEKEKDSIFRTAYDFSDRNGPHYIPAKSEVVIPFSYTLPSYKPATYIGIKINTMLGNGFRLGRSEVRIDSSGEVLSGLQIMNPLIRIGENYNISFTQKPVIYKGEQASFRYILENKNTESIAVTPRITIRERRDTDTVVALYDEQKLEVSGNNKASVINSIRTFDGKPGIYLARVDFLDGDGNGRSTPIVFQYVVDGNIATINSIITDLHEDVVKGEGFSVTVLYAGKPINSRSAKTNEIKDASVVVKVTNDLGQVVSESNTFADLLTQGELTIPLNAEKSGKNLTIEVTFSKDGEVLASDTLFAPITATDQKVSSWVYIIIGLIILFGLLLFAKDKIKARFAILIFIFATTFFGFSSASFAYTTVYTVGDTDLLPTNIVIDQVVGSGASLFPYMNEKFTYSISYVDPPPPTLGPGDTLFEHTVSAFTGERPSPVSSGYHHNPDVIEPWYSSPPSSRLIPGDCAYYSCDGANHDEWIDGTQLFSLGWSCDSNGCEESLGGSGFSGPEETSARIYTYIYVLNVVNDCDSSGSASSGNNCTLVSHDAAMLIYEDLTFVDPYNPGTDAYCYASTDGGLTQVQAISADQPVSWYISPEVSSYDASSGFYSNGCSAGNTTDTNCIGNTKMSKALFRWKGDVGDSAVGSGISGSEAADTAPFSTTLGYLISSEFNAYCSNYYDQSYGSSEWYYDSSNSQCCQDITTTSYENVCSPQCYEDYQEVSYGDWQPVEVCEDVCADQYYTNTTSSCADLPTPPHIYGDSFSTSYASSSISTGSVYPHLEYFDTEGQSVVSIDPYLYGSWQSMSCLPVKSGNDLCANLVGIQVDVPAGYNVHPDPADIGVGATKYEDLYCFPISLAQQGTVSLTGTIETTPDDGQEVSWVYTLSPNFFWGVLDGITFYIPRIATVTWSGNLVNLTDSDETSGTVTFSNSDLSDVDNSKNITYTGSGDAGVTITIEDPYLLTSKTATVVISPPTCDPGDECAPCNPLDVICDNGVPGDESDIESFTVNPVVANENNECSISWTTNDLTYSCLLNSQSGSVSVGTSSAGHLVGPGTYSLSCLNYAPEETVEGPLTCLKNPDTRED